MYTTHCKQCDHLNRTHGTCEKHNAQLVAVTGGGRYEESANIIKWLKCQRCLDEQAKKEKYEDS